MWVEPRYLSGQIRIFHQPKFPWNTGISLTFHHHLGWPTGGKGRYKLPRSINLSIAPPHISSLTKKPFGTLSSTKATCDLRPDTASAGFHPPCSPRPVVKKKNAEKTKKNSKNPWLCLRWIMIYHEYNPFKKKTYKQNKRNKKTQKFTHLANSLRFLMNLGWWICCVLLGTQITLVLVGKDLRPWKQNKGHMGSRFVFGGANQKFRPATLF